MKIAEPPSCSDREPKVPTPRATSSVSPWLTVTCSIGMPRVSVTSMAKLVSWPWPWPLEPV